MRYSAQYICLSTFKTQSDDEERHWFDNCFAVLSAAKVKVHDLGMSQPELLAAYPWTSVDSSTSLNDWGTIAVPPYVDGRPDYRKAPRWVSVGNRMKDKPNHPDQLDKQSLDEVHDFLTEIDLDIGEVRFSRQSRSLAKLRYFARVAEACSVQIFHVTDGTFEQSQLLHGHESRLISWEVLRSKDEDHLECYYLGTLKFKPDTIANERMLLSRWRRGQEVTKRLGKLPFHGPVSVEGEE
jgi:hypothetical protein